MVFVFFADTVNAKARHTSTMMNAIGTHLRDPINLGLTRWRMDAAAELGRNPAIKHQMIKPEYRDEQADAVWDCRARLARPNSQTRARTGKY